MSIAELFTITKCENSQNVYQEINGLTYVHNGTYVHLAVKKTEILIHAPTQMNHKSIMLNDRSHTQKVI